MKPTKEDILSLYTDSETYVTIAKKLGVTKHALLKMIDEYGLPRKTHRHNHGFPEVDPTPEEIAAACKSIQATWTDEIRQNRGRCSLDQIPDYILELSR